ncbi:MAG: O-antigen ligase family protein, partial [Bacteroidota bacterium]
MFTTQIMVEMIVWDYDKYFEPSLSIGGGIDMLYGDPILFGIIAAMGLKLFNGDRRAQDTFYKEVSVWSVFMLWMVFELVRSFAMFGAVNALGEFRTYFREILIIPYVMIFFRTRGEQWKAFQILLWSMMFLILVGFFRGGYVHKFRFEAYAKWLYMHGSLGLLWGTLALYLAQQFGFWRRSKLLFAILIACSLGLTIIASHRSVWLAAFVAVFVLFLMGYFKFGTIIKMGAALFFAAIVINFTYTEINLVGFVQERLVALTDPAEDETASWRVLIWIDALEQSKAFIFEGKGLGNYFTTRLPNGAIVEVMLHNQYIQLIYQVGAIGLFLYITFVIQMYRRL